MELRRYHINKKEINGLVNLDCVRVLKGLLVTNMDSDSVEERQSGQERLIVYPCAKYLEKNIAVSLVLLLVLLLLLYAICHLIRDENFSYSYFKYFTLLSLLCVLTMVT